MKKIIKGFSLLYFQEGVKHNSIAWLSPALFSSDISLSEGKQCMQILKHKYI
jgi:hypothetical protein